MLAVRSPEAKLYSKRVTNRENVVSSSEIDVSFYADVPNYEMSLDEFEEMALTRLKVCKFYICSI